MIISSVSSSISEFQGIGKSLYLNNYPSIVSKDDRKRSYGVSVLHELIDEIKERRDYIFKNNCLYFPILQEWGLKTSRIVAVFVFSSQNVDSEQKISQGLKEFNSHLASYFNMLYLNLSMLRYKKYIKIFEDISSVVFNS